MLVPRVALLTELNYKIKTEDDITNIMSHTLILIGVLSLNIFHFAILQYKLYTEYW